MSGSVNPNSKQMPDWLRKKLQTSTQANTIFMNWVTNKDILSDIVEKKTKIADMVDLAFKTAEAFDNYLEEYLQEPKIQPAKTMPTIIGAKQ
jgi:hypothetical protein